jgi:hypothetical protein
LLLIILYPKFIRQAQWCGIKEINIYTPMRGGGSQNINTFIVNDSVTTCENIKGVL